VPPKKASAQAVMNKGETESCELSDNTSRSSSQRQGSKEVNDSIVMIDKMVSKINPVRPTSPMRISLFHKNNSS
jgi:hypothetical protein